MIVTKTKRPRNVDWKSAAAILYGDWGRAKRTCGPGLCRRRIQFVLADRRHVRIHRAGGHELHGDLPALPERRRGLCERTPSLEDDLDRRRVLLIADYIVTAAISALSAFQYLGRSHPDVCAAIAIVFIGASNTMAKHRPDLAFRISIPAAIVVVLLGAFVLPQCRRR